MDFRLPDSTGSRVIKRVTGVVLCVSAILAGPVVARADTVYVSNWSSDTIMRFTPDGVGSIFYRGGSESFRPTGLTFDSAGNLYAANRYSGIYKFTPDGTISLFPGVLGLNYPRGIAFDSVGNLFVANSYSDEVLRFTPDGSAFSFAFRNGLSYPNDLAFDPAGNLYVANPGLNTIVKFTPEGQGTLFASNGLSSPVGVAFDRGGNLYVANQVNNTIQKFTPEGVGSVFASTGLNAPSGLAFDGAGNLYVANTGDDTVQKFTPSGVGSVFASTGLNAPAFIAVRIEPEVLDSDGDGVSDDVDQCPGSGPGDVVNASGCSIAQLVPCSGPASGGNWKSHGEYVSAIVRTVKAFAAAGLLTPAEGVAVIGAAARSNCGKPRTSATGGRWDMEGRRDGSSKNSR